ncbi:MAG: hypothetical protein Q8L88_07295 [Bacteroidota bacterium]|nr:hypothetical protein [Bacteroidota bacterium]
MITNHKEIEKFEKEFNAKDTLTLDQKFAILNSLYEQARHLGHFTDNDLLDGLDGDIELARKLNLNVPNPSH